MAWNRILVLCLTNDKDRFAPPIPSIYDQARIQGGPKRALAPPPHFVGEKQGAKNHTHRKKRDQNRTTTKQDTG